MHFLMSLQGAVTKFDGRRSEGEQYRGSERSASYEPKIVITGSRIPAGVVEKTFSVDLASVPPDVLPQACPHFRSYYHDQPPLTVVTTIPTIAVLIRGGTMHVQLDTSVPVAFGIPTVLTENREMPVNSRWVEERTGDIKLRWEGKRTKYYCILFEKLFNNASCSLPRVLRGCLHTTGDGNGSLDWNAERRPRTHRPEPSNVLPTPQPSTCLPLDFHPFYNLRAVVPLYVGK